MHPQYITILAGVPKVIGLDTNIAATNIAIRTDADTVEIAVEYPNDATAASPPTVFWLPAPDANAAGLIVLKDPTSAVRFTSAADATATILQQGLQ